MVLSRVNPIFLLCGGAILGVVVTYPGLGAADRTEADEKASKPQNEEMTLQRLIIKDKQGRDRIVIGTDDDQPFIILLDEKRIPRMELSVHADGATGIRIYDERRGTRIELASMPDGSTGIHIYDERRGMRAELASMSNGTSQLVLWDSKSRRSAVTASPDGVSGFCFYDKKGRTVLGLISESDDSHKLLVADKGSRVRAVLGVPKDGFASLVLINSDGRKKVVREPKPK